MSDGFYAQLLSENNTVFLWVCVVASFLLAWYSLNPLFTNGGSVDKWQYYDPCTVAAYVCEIKLTLRISLCQNCWNTVIQAATNHMRITCEWHLCLVSSVTFLSRKLKYNVIWFVRPATNIAVYSLFWKRTWHFVCKVLNKVSYLWISNTTIEQT